MPMDVLYVQNAKYTSTAAMSGSQTSQYVIWGLKQNEKEFRNRQKRMHLMSLQIGRKTVIQRCTSM